MLTYLQTTNVLLGLILALCGAASAVVVFVHRRMRAIATDVAREAAPVRAEIAARLDLVDGDLSRMRSQVSKVAQDVDRLGERVVSVERTMETVARAADVALLRAEVAAMGGRLDERTAAMAGTLDTLYQAALRASQPARAE